MNSLFDQSVENWRITTAVNAVFFIMGQYRDAERHGIRTVLFDVAVNWILRRKLA